MEVVFGFIIAMLLIVFMTSPLWVTFIIHERRKNSVKVGNIYLEYVDSKNPYKNVHQIFKVIDKKDGYIQYEKFQSTDNALNDIPWYSDGERKIDSLSLKHMANWWDDFECWYNIDKENPRNL